MARRKFLKSRKSIICLLITMAFSLNCIPAFASIKVVKLAPEITSPKDMNLKSENKPVSSYWYPEELLKWEATNDPSVNFNKSSVPLAKRVDKSKLQPVNETQNKNINVVAISIMNGGTSGNSPQGTNKFSSNTFSYWQYIDKLVYWGGSAGEGIIVPPSPEITDSAHRNGVPVLGTVFFPQTVHGGKLEWLNKFLEKDSNGNFPMVDKLIEVAELYGFDGWFINQETDETEEEPLTENHAKLMQEFIKDFKKKSNSKFEIMWYDSMTKDGTMDWQNALTDENDYFLIDGANKKVADSMFLNFWWTNDSLAKEDLLKKSREKAKEIGVNPYDLYAGIDIQANGYNTPIRWELFHGNSVNPYTSLGLYCPSWTYFSSENFEEFQEKENRLWVNEFEDPSIETEVSGSEWKGISTYSIEKTVVNKLPFTTNFNMGNGKAFYVNGEKYSNKEWSNRSLGDIMPTYRWIIENDINKNLSADIDYSTAYYGGNSIKVSGKLMEDNLPTIKLYSGDLKLPKTVDFSTVAKSNKTVDLDLKLEFSDNSNAVIKGNKSVENNWTKINYDLSSYSGKTIKTIGYNIDSKEDINDLYLNIGNISINEGTKDIINVSETKVDNAQFTDGIYAGIKLSWKPSKSGVHHYEIYKINNNNSREFIGATPNNTFYIDNLKRSGIEGITNFEVLAVNNSYERGTGEVVSIEWPEYPKPKADFKASKTLVGLGESIELINESSEVTSEVEWNVPEADIISDNLGNITIKYEKEGVYPVTMTAKNISGEDVKIEEGLITVTSKLKGELKDISLGKTATASGFTNENEAPQFALDGIDTTKWCAVGNGPHNITIDLGENKNLSAIKIKHAGAGGESSEMNTKAYRVEVSEDGNNFKEIVNVGNNTKDETIDAFKVTKGRYVRIIVDKATQGADSAARIYGIEVLGIDEQI